MLRPNPRRLLILLVPLTILALAYAFAPNSTLSIRMGAISYIRWNERNEVMSVLRVEYTKRSLRVERLANTYSQDHLRISQSSNTRVYNVW